MSRPNAVRWAAAAVAIALPMAGPAAAQSRWSLGAQVGTSGIGAEVGFMASPHFTIRGEFDNLEYDGDIKGEVLSYKGNFRLNTGAVFADWHPWANPWLVSAGAFFGAREASGGPNLQSTNRIGGDIFTIDQVPGLDAKIKLDSFAPTLAVGWNNTFYNNHWGFKALAGVVFSSQPSVDITATNTPTNLPADVLARLKAALLVEQQRIEDHTDILKTYPLIQLGLSYRF